MKTKRPETTTTTPSKKTSAAAAAATAATAAKSAGPTSSRRGTTTSEATKSKAKPKVAQTRSGLSPLAGSRPRGESPAPVSTPDVSAAVVDGKERSDADKAFKGVDEKKSRSSRKKSPIALAEEAESRAAEEERQQENAPTTTWLPKREERVVSAGDPEPASVEKPKKAGRTKQTASSEEAPAAIAHRSERPGHGAPSPAVVAQIRELEAQLDRLIDEASRRDVSSLVDDDDDDDDDDDNVEVDDGSDLEITRDALPGELSAAQAAAKRYENERASSYDEEQNEELEDGGVGNNIDQRAVKPFFEAPPIPPIAPETPRQGIPSSRLSERGSSSSLPNEATVFDTARELLSSDFYLRKWGRLAMRGRSEEVDDFGFDPIYEQKARTVLEFLYTRYFRVETTGIDRVPSQGRCLLVANHSGTLPLDGVMIKTAVKLEHASPRDVRWLTEDFIYHMPYLGSIMNRLGGVRACQENAERLLSKEKLVAVFPEGVKGIGKLFSERYRLQRFGRGGFIKLCLRTNTPIIPVAVVGAEETNPLLFRIEYLSKALGLPYVPVTPTFPALGPLGLLPAPTKWQIHFGEPIDFGGHGRDAADDELLVGKLAERVRATIQGMLDRAVGSRKSVFFG